jgi:hypothetical protein
MWVPRTPMRPDFCGCPPCPMCYCWAGDDGVVDGITKMTRDMLGDQKPTPAQKKQLKKGAELVHANNIARKESEQLQEQQRRDTEAVKWTEREANAFLTQRAKEKKRAKPRKVDPRPVLDNLDQKELEKRTRVPDRTPEPVSISEWVMPNPYEEYRKQLEQKILREKQSLLYGSVFKAWDWSK